MEEDRESVESVADDKVDDILEDEDVSSEYLPETTKKRIRKRKKPSRKKGILEGEHKQALWEELLILCNEYVKWFQLKTLIVTHIQS